MEEDVKPVQIVGIVILVVGAILLGFAYHASNAPLDRLSNTLTGRFTDETMRYLILGAAAAMAGVLLFLFGKRR
jgi:drug/metabolite transporter (DMT)-like permease